MKINEVEELLQISKANIRFYEKEGLLSSKRAENGYRDYSQEDVDRLKKIVLLRKTGMAIPDIRGVLSGEFSMEDALDRTVKSLEEQMEQLNGSMKLAKTIMSDETVNESFNIDLYWKLMSDEIANGLKFKEIVSDYVEFQKKSLITMWESVFFVPMSEIATKKGWITAILIVFGLCIIRGVGTLVRHGSFFEGFGYPFIIFTIITIITLPLYIIDYRYRDVPLPEPKVSIVKDLLKGLFLVFAFVFVMFAVIGVCDWVMSEFIFQEQYYVVSILIWPLYFLSYAYIFFTIVWMYGKYGLFGNIWKEEVGFRCHLPNKVKKKVLVWSVLVYFMGLLCYCTCYDCFTFDGVKRRVLLYHKEYTWEDVDYYYLSKGTDGVLDYTVVMKDGVQCDCLGGDIGSSCLPENKYPNDTEDYCIELTQKFKAMGVPLRYTDFNKLNDKLSYDYWRDYLKKLQEVIE